MVSQSDGLSDHEHAIQDAPPQANRPVPAPPFWGCNSENFSMTPFRPQMLCFLSLFDFCVYFTAQVASQSDSYVFVPNSCVIDHSLAITNLTSLY